MLFTYFAKGHGQYVVRTIKSRVLMYSTPSPSTHRAWVGLQCTRLLVMGLGTVDHLRLNHKSSVLAVFLSSSHSCFTKGMLFVVL